MAGLLAGSCVGLGCLRSGYQELASEEPAPPENARAEEGGSATRGRSSLDYGFDGGVAIVAVGWRGSRAGRDEGVPAIPGPESSDASPPNSGSAAAGSILGTWSVQGFTDEVGTTYDVCMTISRVDQVGAVAGTIVYDNGLECAGQLTLAAQSGSAYALDETITSGQHQSYCTLGGGGRIEASLAGEDALHWTWRRRTGTLVVADTTLTRVIECP
jgi:hypothetical protein